MHDSEEAEILEQVRQLMHDHGFAVVAVGGGEHGPPWSYTVGLHSAGLPELVIVGGLSSEGQHSTLSMLAERLLAGESLRVGARDPSVIEAFEVTYIEVADTTTEDFAVALRLQSGFRAVQVVWPDTDNRFPWEQGYGFSLVEQRLLGLPPA
ncbi:MAG TPA: DUF4262 domain-containing protein [Solirubrobacteraceae bacterium]